MCIAPGMAEHYETERLKRIVINRAIVPCLNGQGMSVSARHAVDEIIALLIPMAKHVPLPVDVTSPGRVSADRQLAQDLFTLLGEAVAHLDYTGYGDSWERECADASKLPERLDAVLERGRAAGLIAAE